MKKIIGMIAILVIVSSLSGFLLSWVYSSTSKKIETQKEEKLLSSLKKVLPEADSFYSLLEGRVWAGYREGEKVGIVFRNFSRGYGGDIELIVGLGMDGRVKGVTIGDMKETPGLGTQTKKPEFLNQFINKVKEQIRLKQDGGEIVGITAATISSRAVTDGVRKGIEKYERYIKAVDIPYFKEILNDADLIVPLKKDTLFVGYRDTVIVGYIVKTEGRGFSGPIPIAVSFDTSLTIKGIWIADREHGLKETEGFGTRILSEDFKNRFIGKNRDDLDKVDVITGATVSSRGVIDGVKKAFDMLLGYLNR